MKALGVICARAGSKTLPGKNIVPFNGVPLVVRSAETALRSRYLLDVCVSTNDPYVERLVEGLVKVIDRPDCLALDDSPIHEAVLHALMEMEAMMKLQDGEEFKYSAVVCLQNSQPLRIAEDIDRALVMLAHDPPCDTVMSVVERENYHPDLAFVDSSNGGLIRHERNDPENFRRQDRGKVFFMSGIVFAMRRDSFVADPFVPCGAMRGLVIPEHRAIDIHSWRDWKIAEAIADLG
jgi:CMP-N-acetylneuraminic acid synthetase